MDSSCTSPEILRDDGNVPPNTPDLSLLEEILVEESKRQEGRLKDYFESQDVLCLQTQEPSMDSCVDVR